MEGHAGAGGLNPPTSEAVTEKLADDPGSAAPVTTFNPADSQRFSPQSGPVDGGEPRPSCPTPLIRAKLVVQLPLSLGSTVDTDRTYSHILRYG
jgi:hypothetical protein